eukprot:g8010.t1
MSDFFSSVGLASPAAAFSAVSVAALLSHVFLRHNKQRSIGRTYVLPGPLLMGQDKWLGGVCSPCGKFIYGVPGHAKRVLKITIATGEYELIGPKYKGQFKWLRGVEIPKSYTGTTQKLYCLPSNGGKYGVLKILPDTHEVSTIGGPYEGDWLWHGGVLSEVDGNVYAIPCNATGVLKIDPRTDKVTVIGGPWPDEPKRQKWYGGIVGHDGNIYGIPQCASGVLKINPRTQECTIIGKEEVSQHGQGQKMGWKWHGGFYCKETGAIYGIPSNADAVLKIDTKTDTVTTIGYPLNREWSHRQDGRYKYLGGAIGPDGYCYFFPCDAERVLRVDLRTDKCKTIGPKFMEGMNKWQNGFCASDGCIYAIPQRAYGILKIEPSADRTKDATVLSLDCGGGEYMKFQKDKFEAAVMGADGAMYCIPLRAKQIVKIIPGREKL